MNAALVFCLSIIDAMAILPFNAELSLLFYLKKRTYNFLNYLLVTSGIYVLPSLIGTVVAYFIGFYFGNAISTAVDFLVKSVFMYSVTLTQTGLLTTLFFKMFLPVVPVSLLNILCGIYSTNFFYFMLISTFLRVLRMFVMYNAVIFSSLYHYVTMIFYMGLYTVFVRFCVIIFYKFLFIQ